MGAERAAAHAEAQRERTAAPEGSPRSVDGEFATARHGLLAQQFGARARTNPGYLLHLQRVWGNHAVSHLLQAAPAAASTASIVQRKRNRNKKGMPASAHRVVGELVVYEKLTNAQIGGEFRFSLTKETLELKKRQGTPLLSGTFDASVSFSGGTVLKWGDHTIPLTRVPARFAKDVSGNRLVLRLDVHDGSAIREDYTPGTLPPEAKQEQGKAGDEKAPPRTPGGGGEPGGGDSPVHDKTPGGTKGKPPEVEPATTRTGGNPGGAGTGTEAGSKYGWLGWLKLDQDTIDALEKIFEAMGSSAEFAALQETLETLLDLARHADQLPELLSPDELVKFVLGLESTQTQGIVGELETWVGSATRADPAATRDSGKGIVAMASKLLKLVRKLRRSLQPVFATRGTFQAVFGVLNAVLADLDSFPLLMAHLQGNPLSPDDLKQLTRRIGTQAARQFTLELQQAKADIQIAAETFSKAELLKREDIARAIVAGAALATPAPYKPFVWVLDKAEVDTLVADNLVDKLIPQWAVAAINDALLSIAAPLADASKNLSKHLESVFTAAEAVAAEKIPGAIATALPPSAAPIQRANNSTLLGGYLASVAGQAVKGLATTIPKKGDPNVSDAASDVEAWLARNEKRQVVSKDDPRLPSLYYSYVPSSPKRKPRLIVRTARGVVAGVPPLRIYKGMLWRGGRVLSEKRDASNDHQLTITSELGPPSTRKDYEKLLPTGIEVLNVTDWHRAHSHGATGGAESAQGILLAPDDVNLKLQGAFERYFRDIVLVRKAGVRITMITETHAWPRTRRLKDIRYTLKLAHPGAKSVEVFSGWLTVTNSVYDPIADFHVDEKEPSWNSLDSYLDSDPTRGLPKPKRKRKKK